MVENRQNSKAWPPGPEEDRVTGTQQKKAKRNTKQRKRETKRMGPNNERSNGKGEEEAGEKAGNNARNPPQETYMREYESEDLSFQFSDFLETSLSGVLEFECL